MTWLTQLISAMTNSFTSLSSSIMTTILDSFKTLFLEVDAQGAITGVTPVAIFIFFGLGISLCLGLTKWVTSFARKKI